MCGNAEARIYSHDSFTGPRRGPIQQHTPHTNTQYLTTASNKPDPYPHALEAVRRVAFKVRRALVDDLVFHQRIDHFCGPPNRSTDTHGAESRDNERKGQSKSGRISPPYSALDRTSLINRRSRRHVSGGVYYNTTGRTLANYVQRESFSPTPELGMRECRWWIFIFFPGMRRDSWGCPFLGFSTNSVDYSFSKKSRVSSWAPA